MPLVGGFGYLELLLYGIRSNQSEQNIVGTQPIRVVNTEPSLAPSRYHFCELNGTDDCVLFLVHSVSAAGGADLVM